MNCDRNTRKYKEDHQAYYLCYFNVIFTISEKTEPFYDEFIEKQLLAGNIPSRNVNITVVSVTVTLPAADHGKMPPAGYVMQTSSSTELHAVSSQLSLQSIQEQEVCFPCFVLILYQCPFVPLFINSLFHLLTNSLKHLLIIHSSSHPLLCKSIHLPIHPSIHLFIHFFIHSFFPDIHVCYYLTMIVFTLAEDQLKG